MTSWPGTSGMSGNSPVGLFGRQTKTRSAFVGIVHDRGAGHGRGEGVHRIRERGHGGDGAAFGEEPREQDDELVAAGADGDLIDAHAVSIAIADRNER
jgi:hypothetical protein